VTVTIHGADDAPVANVDDFFTTAPATVTGHNLFDDNSFGPDNDPDGPALSISAVNGDAGNVGHQITLTSGALLTVNSDGTFTYDPNHAFDGLAAPGSGAANTTTTDTFTYTLTGGGTATATVTIDGVDNANTVYQGSGGNDTITGSASLPDLFHLEQGGNDTATGGSGDDGFYFGGAFNGSDHVDGAGGSNNQIGLEGDYSGANAITLGPTTLTNIQVIAMLPGFSYNLTTDDGNVAAGQNLTIWAAHLAASNTLTFNGSAELDGSFTVFGGAGNDAITGGHGDDTLLGLGGADTLTGGLGADHFTYTAVAESTGNANGTAYDTITDFDASADAFHLFPAGVTSGVDTPIVLGTLDSGGGTFDTELAAAVNLTNLAAHHAVLFTPNLGNLATHTFLIVDANGQAGYQAGQDFVFDVTNASHLASLGTGDFI
jgi:VCBS repeat-containing protein